MHLETSFLTSSIQGLTVHSSMQQGAEQMNQGRGYMGQALNAQQGGYINCLIALIASNRPYHPKLLSTKAVQAHCISILHTNYL